MTDDPRIGRRRMEDSYSIAGDDPLERIMLSMRSQARMYPGIELPSRMQLALAYRALADHTLLMAALEFSREAEDRFWPEATSLGRFFHALADKAADTFVGDARGQGEQP